MKFITRLGYYLGGFSIGLILLAFFLGGKKTSCDYGPNARTVKNILTKKSQFSQEFADDLANMKIDSTELRAFISLGNVDFDKSIIGKDSCNNYFIENTINEKPFIVEIENCDSIAYYQKISPK